MKKVTKLTAVCFFVLSAFGVGCTSDGYKATENRTYEPVKAASHDYGKSAVLSFNKGSSDLSEPDKEKLRQIISSVGVDNISRVEIASWSDKAFPKTGPDLPKADRNLADARADRIKDFLKDETELSMLRMRKYSMAETSNWLARMFRTDEAELKSVFAKEGETPMVRDDFNVIMNEGGPSKAVLVVIRK